MDCSLKILSYLKNTTKETVRIGAFNVNISYPKPILENPNALDAIQV